MSTLWALTKLLPDLLRFGKALIERWDLEQARDMIRQGKQEVQELDEDLRDNPVDASRGFLSRGLLDSESDASDG